MELVYMAPRKILKNHFHDEFHFGHIGQLVMKGEINMDLRTRVLMLVEKTDKMPCSLDDLLKKVANLPHIDKWASILHDKDVGQHNEIVAPHYHITITFDTRQRVNTVAKRLGVKPEQLEVMSRRGVSNGIENAFAYLIHATKDASNKHQYDPNEVTANFNYPEYMEQLQLKLNSQDTKDSILDDYAKRACSKSEALLRLRNLGGHELALYSRQLNNIDDALNDLQAQEALDYQKTHNIPHAVYYFWGESGAGKTSCARALASYLAAKYGRNANDWWETGSSNDPFDSMKPATVTVWDEMRANSRLEYSDTLGILNNNGAMGYMVNSRFHNKLFVSPIMIITSIMGPYELYSEMDKAGKLTENRDPFSQLARRLNGGVYWFTHNQITCQSYKSAGRGYGIFENLNNEKTANPFNFYPFVGDQVKKAMEWFDSETKFNSQRNKEIRY